ncbi:MAG: NUDIX domain-containing protein [Oscillospiraceae bacterium]|nr:NUDIX domain-containing protein [Oscillospiraceae bacterium]
MGKDLCIDYDGGVVNIRVGAIIMRDGSFLMVGNPNFDYLYSVGGRIRFGETAEEAVVREVREETGRDMEIDRLGFVTEDFFLGDSPAKMGKLIYELGYYFYMKTPADFAPVCESFTEDGSEEFLVWAAPEEGRKMYPAFFNDELRHPEQTIKHFVTDQRE